MLTRLTAVAAVHIDLRTLLGRDDPLGFPCARGADTAELTLQHGSGIGHSCVAPAPGRARRPEKDPGRFNYTSGN